MPIPEPPENQPRGNRPAREPGSPHRRRSRGRRWKDSRLAKAWQAWLGRFYDWWYPPADPAGAGGSGHGGRAPKNRLHRAWRRGGRWLKHLAASRGYRTLRARWWNWWYPPADYPGQRPENRLARFRRRWGRRLGQSAASRDYQTLRARWWNWWYPPADRPGHATENRWERFWRRWGRRLGHSAAGRGYQTLRTRWWNWWYPPADRPGHRPENRLARWWRRWDRWFRKTWPGRKVEWVRADAAEFFTTSRRQFQELTARKRFWKRLFAWRTAAVIAVLAALPVAGYHYGWPYFQKYQEQRYALQAQQLLAKGDWTRALLRCRQVLSLNFSNAAATRIFADLADSYDSPAALYWRQRALLLGPGLTNQMALAATAVKLEPFPFPTAAKVLGQIAPPFQQTPDYQRVAGVLALKLARTGEAEQHFLQAYTLDPSNAMNRLSLAVIRLQARDARVLEDSRTTLELLMNDHQVGLLATRSLVAESIDRGDFQRAEKLSRLVLQNAQSTFGDRLLHLVILQARPGTNFPAFLEATEQRAQTNAANAGQLATWMNSAGLARQALDWLGRLPPEFTKQSLLPVAQADAYVRLAQWAPLENYLRARPWPGWDHIRFAMMALADAKQSGSLEDAVAWRSAIELAAGSPNALNALARLAAAWGWPERAREVFWLASQKYPDQPWPLDSLGELYTRQQDTAGVFKVAKTAFQNHPDDPMAGNNYAMLSLLLEADPAQAEQVARKLYAAQPKNPVFASTYAFSLYRQGRAQEGVKVLRELGAGPLNNPAIAVYYGILLAASGDAAAAKPYLDQSAKARLLPEEQALVKQAIGARQK